MPSRPRRTLRIALRACLTGMLMTTLLVTAAGTAAAAPPPNDDRADAIVLEGPLPITVEGDNPEATSGEGDPYDYCEFDALFNTVWYSYTPVEDESLAMTVASETSLVASAYLFTDEGAIEWETPCPSARQLVSFEGGRTYYLLVSSPWYASEGGPFTLTLSAPPPAVEADVRITSVQYQRVAAIATITGTVRCNQDASFSFYGFLRQARNRPPVVSQTDFYGSTLDGRCGPARERWSVEVFPALPLRFANAYVRVNADACDGFTCDSLTVARTLRVTRAPR